MKFNQLVQKRMLLLIILIVVFFGYFGSKQNVEINKTVNWAWDISNWLLFAKSYSWLLFIFGYGLLAVFKSSTHKELSKFHLILIILTFLLDDLLKSGLAWLFSLHLISILVFFMNIKWSIRNRKKKINSN